MPFVGDSFDPDSGKFLGGFIGIGIALAVFFLSSMGYSVGGSLFQTLLFIPCVAVLLLGGSGLERRITALVIGKKDMDDETPSVFALILYGAMVALSAVAYYRIAASFAYMFSWNIMYVPLLASVWGLIRCMLALRKRKAVKKVKKYKKYRQVRKVHMAGLILFGVMLVFSIIGFLGIYN